MADTGRNWLGGKGEQGKGDGEEELSSPGGEGQGGEGCRRVNCEKQIQAQVGTGDGCWGKLDGSRGQSLMKST